MPIVAALTVLEYVRDADAVWNLPPKLLAWLKDAFPDITFVSPATRAEADALIPSADAVFGWAVGPENFASAARLKWVHVSAAGVGPLLFPALVESDVVLTNGRGLHSVAMAEHALGVILGFARKLHLARDAQREHLWTQKEMWAGALPFGELAGSVLGLVGLGAVGGALAERARALGLTVIAVRRRPEQGAAQAHEQWGSERLPELLTRADWLVLSAPLTSETRGLIGAEELKRMKPTSVLINLGRGALVDERALIAALKEGRIAGAALDVFEVEPLPAESPLWDMPNVIITPHISGLGPRYWERAVEMFADNLRAFQSGAPLKNIVDKRAGY